MPRDLPGAIVAALQTVLGTPHAPIPLHEPLLGDDEADAVAQAVRSGWVSSAGPDIARFEAAIGKVTGAPHVVAVASGTAGLHLACLVAGVRPNDEVLVPALTFAATANAIAHSGAVPHFVEVEAATLSVDPVALEAHLARIAERRNGAIRNRETGRRIAALIVVHPFGSVAPMPSLLDVARAFGLPVIEDAAEAMGATFECRAAGTFAPLGVLSFNGNKIITTGSGGAILTADGSLAARARHLSTTAKQPHVWRYEHDMVGYNYRLPNLNAALGVAQIARLDAFIAAKRALIARYETALAGVAGVHMMAEPPGVRGNGWLATLLIENGSRALLDAVLAACHGASYLCRPAWTPLHLLPMHRDCPRMMLLETERLAESIVNLPSGPGLAIATRER